MENLSNIGVQDSAINNNTDNSKFKIPFDNFVNVHSAPASLFNGYQEEEDPELVEVRSLVSESRSFPPTYEIALALNQSYQDVIEEYTKKLEALLAQNREGQKRVQDELAGYGNPARLQTKVPTQIYLPPYFRDSAGIGPPLNHDAQRKRKSCEFDALTLPPKKWYSHEKEMLYKGVKQSKLESLLKTVISKKELIQEKLLTTGLDEPKKMNELKANLQNIEFDIAKIRCLPEAQLMRDSNTKVDWMKVSSCDLKGTRSVSECELMWNNNMQPKWNQTEKWDKDELKKLKGLVEKAIKKNETAISSKKRNQKVDDSGQWWVDWNDIADSLGTNRTPFQCFEKYRSELDDEIMKRNWTPQEDRVLQEVVDNCKQGNYIPWEQVAYYMEGRTRNQVQMRWIRTLDPQLKRGRWTETEDLLLVAAVQKYGGKDWNKVSEMVPGRTDAQCRERWCGSLDASIKMGVWTEDEDCRLLEGVKRLGEGHWAVICKLIPGRTPAACKIRYKVMNKFGRRNGILTNGNSLLHEQMVLKIEVPERCKKRIEYAERRKQMLRSQYEGMGGSYPDLMSTFMPRGILEANLTLVQSKLIQNRRINITVDTRRQNELLDLAVALQLTEKGKQLRAVLRHLADHLNQRTSDGRIDILPPNLSTLRAFRKLISLNEFLARSAAPLCPQPAVQQRDNLLQQNAPNNLVLAGYQSSQPTISKNTPTAIDAGAKRDKSMLSSVFDVYDDAGKDIYSSNELPQWIKTTMVEPNCIRVYNRMRALFLWPAMMSQLEEA